MSDWDGNGSGPVSSAFAQPDVSPFHNEAGQDAVVDAYNGQDGSRELSRNGSTMRMNAVAMLKRAASQREMRSKSPGPNLGLSGDGASVTPPQEVNLENGGTSQTTSPMLNSNVWSPSPANMLSGTLSPNSRSPDSGALHVPRPLLDSGKRSPLPSLEQLRARILTERATEGLARSASTSAASAAARRYAMEKLLGRSGREGAVSPVSDTAEDEEETQKRESEVKVERTLLRRSRTIGGLSAAAEAQRKAAFVEALDQGVPEDLRSARRSSRRFAHAPPGGSMVRTDSDTGSTSKLTPLPETEATTLERNASQRQQVRTEMLRKLSTRRGAQSPADVLEKASEGQDGATLHAVPISNSDPDVVSRGLLHPLGNFDVNQYKASTPTPNSPNARTPFTPSPHAQTRLLTVPLGSVTRAASTHSSATGMHEDERNRASVLARLHGEEAFEYERLLEMGYSTDDAFERVASARSGSFIDHSAAVSPRSIQEEFGTFNAQGPSTPILGSIAKVVDQDSSSVVNGAVILSPGNAVPRNVSPTQASDPNTTPMQQDEWVTKRPSAASIPLGYEDTSMAADGDGDDGQLNSVRIRTSEDLKTGESGHKTLSAYPESVVAASNTSLSSSNRDSLARAARPPNLSIPATTGARLDRIEDLLTPGFLSEVGNPLDYSHSPSRSPQTPRHVMAREEADNDSGGSTDGADITTDQDDPLANVDKMTRRLEKFMKQSKRSRRDQNVVQSSAAQVQAAATDFVRQDLATSQSISDEALARNARHSPAPTREMESRAASASPSARADARAVSPAAERTMQEAPAIWNPDTEAQTPYSSNEKLNPFPGLLQAGNVGAQQPSQKIVKRKPSPLASAALEAASKVNDTSPKIAQEAVVVEQDRDFDSKNPPSSSKETFFTSLRRKASRRTPGEKNGVDPGQSADTSAKKIASFLTRKASGKMQSTNQSPILDIGSPTIPDEATPSTTGKLSSVSMSAGNENHLQGGPSPAAVTALRQGSHHSRNASVTSINTVHQTDDPSLTLDMGHANQPSTLAAPAALAPATAAVLQRFSRVLTSPNEASSLPSIPGVSVSQLQNPPRRFVMAAPVLQVVTTSTVKDRFVFLFSDLVIFAKPVRPIGKQTDKNALPTLAWTFAVKTILSLDDVKLTTPKGERRQIMAHTPLMRAFVSDFLRDPMMALQSVIDQSGLPNDLNTMAKLLHQTPDLDRQGLSDFIFNKKNAQLMRAFVYQERFAGVSIESALRSLLLELRFPSDREALQEMLITFAQQWTDTNRGLIKDTFTSRLAVDLVTAIMSLNDALHSHHSQTPGYFSEPDQGMTKDRFIERFRREHDPAVVLSDRTLLRIYTSVSADVIQQNMLPDEEPGKPLYVRILAPGVPNRIVYGQPSEPIRVAIPRVDAGFVVRLYGQNMTFQPQILTFDKSHVQEFRVMSKSLGPHSIVFVKAGRHARHYRSSAHEVGEDFPLPRSINVSVQRAFMQHCFSLTVPNKRRFMISVEDEGKRKQWLRSIKESLDRQQKAATGKALARGPGSAQALALHVLRESLIKPDVANASALAALQRSASSATPSTSKSNHGALAASALSRAPSDTRALLHPLHGIGAAAMGLSNSASSFNGAVSRQESISRHYYGEKGAGHSERDLLGSASESANDGTAGGNGSKKAVMKLATIPSGSDQVDFRQMTNETKASSSLEPLSGQDLILTVRQNSLLALAISHAQQQSTTFTTNPTKP